MEYKIILFLFTLQERISLMPNAPDTSMMDNTCTNVGISRNPFKWTHIFVPNDGLCTITNTWAIFCR
jgi:hypothetical protein